MTPNGWKGSRLGDVLERVVGGGTPDRNKSEYWGGEIPWASVKDLRSPVMDATQESITAAGVASSATRVVPAGTLVVGVRMAPGRAVRFRRDVAINQDLKALFLKSDLVDADFLHQWFHSRQPDFEAQATGSTVKGIRVETLVGADLLVPPLAEQRKIAAILSSVDDAIEATQKVIDQVQIVKTAMMAELLTRGLPGRHTKFKMTEIGEIPEEWEVARIVDVADVDYGISAAVSKNTNPSIGWPIITGANLTLGGELDLSEVVYHPRPKSPQHLLKAGDLLLNWRSGSSAHVGKTALFDRDGDFTYASFVLRIRSRGRLVPRFGHALLNFMRAKDYFSRDLSQQVNFKMNAAVFRDVLIRVPPLEEQESIATACCNLDASARSNRAAVEQLREIKGALMSVLLTGEVRVKPDEEAA